MKNLQIIILSTFILTLYFSQVNFAQRLIPIGRNENTKSKRLRQNNNHKKSVKRERNQRQEKKQTRTSSGSRTKIRNENNYSSDTYIQNEYVEQYDYLNSDLYDQVNYSKTYYADDICVAEPVSPYPNFPLIFKTGKINYLTTLKEYDEKNNLYSSDIFELKIKVRVLKDDFFNQFAVQLKYNDGTEQLEIFNEEESFLYWGKEYTFTKEIALRTTGYINLRIGYYNTIEQQFYPEKKIPKKTVLLVYVRK